jgi:copper chaperone CopZ
VTKVEMKGKKAEVTYDTALTDEKKIIEGFNSDGGRYKASKS